MADARSSVHDSASGLGLYPGDSEPVARRRIGKLKFFLARTGMMMRASSLGPLEARVRHMVVSARDSARYITRLFFEPMQSASVVPVIKYIRLDGSSELHVSTPRPARCGTSTMHVSV